MEAVVWILVLVAWQHTDVLEVAPKEEERPRRDGWETTEDICSCYSAGGWAVEASSTSCWVEETNYCDHRDDGARSHSLRLRSVVQVVVGDDDTE
jgi:hypothetical protein